MPLDKYAAVHADPQGEGDARPTAKQIIADAQVEGKFNDKVVLITGCSSGIGVETAKAMALTGATLYLTARDLNKAKEALGDLVKSDKVHLLQLDLSTLDSVRKGAQEFLSKSQKLNILILNAGIMACPEGKTKDGFETQIGTNHFAQFLLFTLLRPVLLSSSTSTFNSRVVVLASLAHRYGPPNVDNINLDGCYEKWKAYGASKTANIWMANELDRLYGSKGLHGLSVHPGGIKTGLSQHLTEEEFGAFSKDPSWLKVFKSVEQGAATTVWAATSPDLEGVGGKYLEDCQVSAPFDPSKGFVNPGHMQWAYQPEGEKKLWELSEKLTSAPQHNL